MSRKNIAVLNFGTNHVSVLIGDRGVNNTFDIKGFSQSVYGGYMNGEFLEPEKLPLVVQDCIADAQNNAFLNITDLCVGVPAEFSAVVVKDVSIDFEKKRKVTNDDIESLFELADDFGSSPTHQVANKCPIYYVTDNGTKVIDPIGVATTSLQAILSFVLVEKNFWGFVNRILSPLGFRNVEFFSEPLSECLYLLDPEVRDGFSILVDCGYLSTSVSLVMGDGLLCMRSFSLGGGHIMADMCSAFKLTPEQAENLKQQIAFDVEPTEADSYIIKNADGEDISINAVEANQVAKYRIEQIGKMIKKCLKDFDFEYPDYIPINITGGGVCYTKGAINILSKVLDKDVQIVAPQVPLMEEPVSSSILGLLDLALKQHKPKPMSIFLRIFKFKKK